jgi:regulator of sigma E protease
MIGFLVFLIIFAVVVFVHELGHFLVAKKSGILCREFAIGFGPKIFVMKHGETTYTFRLLPLGGFVSMAGEDGNVEDIIKPGQTLGILLTPDNIINHIFIDNYSELKDIHMVTAVNIDFEHELSLTVQEGNSDEVIILKCSRETIIHSNKQKILIAPADRRFNNKPLKNRFMTIFAGPFMNFILAFILFAIGYLAYGTPTNQLEEIMDNSPASIASLQEGDVIIKINGDYMDDWFEIQDYISKHPGEEVDITIRRNSNTKVIPITVDIVKDKLGDQTVDRGYIGIMPFHDKSPLGAIKNSFQQTGNYIFLILDSLKELVTGNLSLNSLSGPIGIYKVTDTVTGLGMQSIINFAAFLSINLGIFNLLPVPSLDGGRLFFLTAEFVRGKKVNSQLEGVFHFAGFLLLIILMIIVTWNDITKMY